MILVICSNYTAGEFDTTYEYIESPPKSASLSTNISVMYDVASEKISTDPPLTEMTEKQNSAVHYHDVGPDASNPPELPARGKLETPVHGQNTRENEYHYADARVTDELSTSYSGEPLLFSSNFVVNPSAFTANRNSTHNHNYCTYRILVKASKRTYLTQQGYTYQLQ